MGELTRKIAVNTGGNRGIGLFMEPLFFKMVRQ